MNRQTRVYDDIFEMLPSTENPTPLVRVRRTLPEGIRGTGLRLYGKLEWMNPFGSVKDRAAAALIAQLERDGAVSGERGIVEPTSGNTGLSLAVMASAKGYRMRAVVPDKVPTEKKLLLRIAGADLDVINDNLCPAPGLGEGSIGIARSYARAQPERYSMPNQYENPANTGAHAETTGPEIWRQTEGKITHFFASLGTAGTIVGTGRYLKSQNPAVKIIAVVPDEGHDVPGLRTPSELAATNLYDPSVVDEVVVVEHERAYTAALELIRGEGLLAGPSSGLIYEGARRVLSRDPAAAGSAVGVMILCDDVFKYTAHFAKHVPELLEGTSP